MSLGRTRQTEVNNHLRALHDLDRICLEQHRGQAWLDDGNWLIQQPTARRTARPGKFKSGISG